MHYVYAHMLIHMHGHLTGNTFLIKSKYIFFNSRLLHTFFEDATCQNDSQSIQD